MPAKLPQVIFETEDPAVNTNIDYTITEDVIMELNNLCVGLVTDANVANRRVVLSIERNAKVIYAIGNNTDIVASTTAYVNFGKGLPVGASGNYYTCPIPDDFRLLKGDHVKITVVAKAAGDNLGAGEATGFKYLK